LVLTGLFGSVWRDIFGPAWIDTFWSCLDRPIWSWLTYLVLFGEINLVMAGLFGPVWRELWPCLERERERERELACSELVALFYVWFSALVLSQGLSCHRFGLQ
jgi:hypothetical protein